MKHDWEYKKLGESCILTMGQSPSSDSYNSEGEGLPFFQGCSDFGLIHPTITTFCTAPTKIAQADDVLMSVRAPIGTLNIADVECCIGRGLASFRANNDGVSKFLYYVLKYSKDKLQSLGTGSTFKAIGKDSLRNFIIPVPPLPIQEQIVSELDKVSEIIEKKKQQVKELDNLAQSIFYDMFGDPVENEKGWDVKVMGDIGNFQRGSGLSKKVLVVDGYPCILYGQIHTRFGAFTKKHLSCIPNELVHTAKIAHPNDLIIAITSEDVEGSCKSTAWLGNYDIAVGSDAAIFSHNQNSIYVSYYTKTKAFYNEKAKYARGFKVTHISTKEIATISIMLPPLSLQRSFAQKIEVIEKQKELITASIKEAQTLFDARRDYWFGE